MRALLIAVLALVFAASAAAMNAGQEDGKPVCTPDIYGAHYWGPADYGGSEIEWICDDLSAPWWDAIDGR